MKGFALIALALTAGISAFGADLGAIKGIVGSYPVLEWNGNPRAAGVVEIVANESGVGFTLQPLALASYPVTPVSILAPIATTSVSRTGNVVTQESTIGDTRYHIEYQLFAGYVDIVAQTCPKAWPRCETMQVGISSGKATGEKVDFKTFATQVQGSYRIELVGGEKPKELDNTADVSLDTDEADFTMPYCPPGTTSCDPGYLTFKWGATEVFHRVLGPGDELFTLLAHDGSRLLHYSWEVVGRTVTFRNFQYRFKTSPVIALEHVMHRL